MLQDLRFALRLIAKDRWLSAVAIVALALGIGVNAIGFTVINAVFLRGLPYKDADRLYLLAWQTRSGSRSNLSPAELHDWRAESRSFAGLAAFTDGTINISDASALPEQARGAWVSANTFRLLGQPPLLGRDFAEGEDRVGAEPLVIIGAGIWKNRYGSDPNVIGRVLRMNGQRATIVGVMPDSMKFPFNTDIWALLVPADGVERDARSLNVFGRLREGTAVAGARAELNGIAARLVAAYPDVSKDLVGVRMETFTERFIGGKAKVLFPTRIALSGDRVALEIDLTPGAAVAPRIFARIDRDGDGQVTGVEIERYADAVLSNLVLEIDGRASLLTLTRAECPSWSEIRDGDGTIRLRAETPEHQKQPRSTQSTQSGAFSAIFARSAVAFHLHYENRHEPAMSVYL